MNVETALRQRSSIRAFSNTPVARELIASILEIARFSPSGSNIQPWHVHVVTDDARAQIVRDVRHAAEFERHLHPPAYNYYPPQWRDPYLARRRACGWGLYSLLGITKGDRVRGLQQELRNFDFFDAPVGLFFFIDDDIPYGGWLDYGMFLQSIMLVAQSKGLATCPQAAWAPFHRIIRRVVGAPESQTLICGIALGYADNTAAVNSYRPQRVDADEFTTWHLSGEGN